MYLRLTIVIYGLTELIEKHEHEKQIPKVQNNLFVYLLWMRGQQPLKIKKLSNEQI